MYNSVQGPLFSAIEKTKEKTWQCHLLIEVIHTHTSFKVWILDTLKTMIIVVEQL